MQIRLVKLLILSSIALGACQPASFVASPVAGASPSAPAEPAASLSPAAVSTLTPASSAAGWTEYRDARYGYGIALPCYWRVTPTPADGIFAAMTAHSYSEEFFAQHSERGEWIGGVWPAGAYKLDAVGFENMDPALSAPDAIRAWYGNPQNSSEQELLSVEETSFGRQTGYIATLQSGLQGGERVRIVYFPLQPGKLIGFVFLPQPALDAPDVQAILASFAATPAEPVSFPSNPPTGPQDGGSVSCS